MFIYFFFPLDTSSAGESGLLPPGEGGPCLFLSRLICLRSRRNLRDFTVNRASAFFNCCCSSCTCDSSALIFSSCVIFGVVHVVVVVVPLIGSCGAEDRLSFLGVVMRVRSLWQFSGDVAVMVGVVVCLPTDWTFESETAWAIFCCPARSGDGGGVNELVL